MKLKRIKKKLVGVLAAGVMLTLPFAFVQMDDTAKANADSPSVGNNLYSMEFSTKTDGDAEGKIHWGTREYVGLVPSTPYHYFNQREGWDSEHGQTYELVSTGNGQPSPVVMNFDIDWEAGKTYSISYWIKTSATMTDFILSPRAELNDVKMSFDGNDFIPSATSTNPASSPVAKHVPRFFGSKITSAVPEWTRFSYTFTASANATTTGNHFGFHVKIPTAGQSLSFADIQVREVENLFDKTTATVATDAASTNACEMTTEAHGATRFTMTEASTASTQKVEYKHAIDWKANTTYNITYTVLTNATAEGFRAAGFASVNGAETNLQMGNLGSFTSGHVGRLYTMSYNFTPDAAASSGENAVIFRIWNGFAVDDFVELYNVSVVEVPASTAPQAPVEDSLLNESDLILKDTSDAAVLASDITYTQVNDLTEAPDGHPVPYAADSKVYKLQRLTTGAKDYSLSAEFDAVEGVSYIASFWVYGGNSLGAYSEFSADRVTGDKPWIIPSVYAGGTATNINEIRGYSATTMNMSWTKIRFGFQAQSTEDGEFKLTFTNTDSTYGGIYYIADLSVAPQSHAFIKEIPTTNYLKEGGEYYHSCIYCGESSQGHTNSTFTVETDILSFEGLTDTKAMMDNAEIGTLPAVPNKTGYANDGKWYIDNVEITATTRWTYGANKTATPKYTANTYSLTLSGVTDPVRVTYDQAIGTLPEVPAKTGHTTDGKWYIGNTAITSATVWNYAENKTAEPKYTVGTYTLTLEGVTEPIQVTYNQAVGTLPEVAKKAGYTTDGKWYIGDAEVTATTVWSYGENKTAAPKYVANTYKLTLNGVTDPITVTYGQAIGTLPAVPAVEGKTNDGKWYIGVLEITAQTVWAYEENKTAQGKYSDISYAVTLPTGDGYEVTGESTVAHGGNYEFTVTVKEGYDEKSLVVKVNGTEVTATDGKYTVSSVTADVSVEITVNKEEKKKGCGSSLGASVAAITLGVAAAVAVRKRKENE